MVFKDILVNYNKSSKERLQFVIEKLNQLNEDERVIFVGNTFYTNDLNLSHFIEFIKILNQHKEHDIYIQDVEALSAKLTKTKVKSWYSLPTWPSHVKLYMSTEDIQLTSEEIRYGLKYKEKSSFNDESHILEDTNSYDAQKYDLKDEIISQKLIYQDHQEDLIGSFIDEVKSLSYSQVKEVSIIKNGLDALLRR